MPPDTNAEEEEKPKWENVVIDQPELKKAKISGIPYTGSEGSLVPSQSSDFEWNSIDIAKAGDLLLLPPDKTPDFQDEEEMRRIFSLIYDVFRCKEKKNPFVHPPTPITYHTPPVC